jgi:dienelactone hydrolase
LWPTAADDLVSGKISTIVHEWSASMKRNIVHRIALRALMSLAVLASFNNSLAQESERVSILSHGWELVGDLQHPGTPAVVPGVLLLNSAAGNRHVYKDLAGQLANRGIASLRLDLRGHGDSTNLDRFVPEESDSEAREIMIWDSEADVISAYEYLNAHPRIHPNRIGIVGASYSGEEMAEAGRIHRFAQAYVTLSPGSFSEDSITAMDVSAVPWLFVVSRQERHLKDIAAAVQGTTMTVEILYIPGDAHATRILESRQDLAERIAVWLASKL